MHFTFLNWSRLPSIIPKDPTTIGFCEFFRIVGNNCCTLIGNKYQSNRCNRSVISSNVLVILWQTSHERNTIPNMKTPKKIHFHSRTWSIVSADCKVREIDWTYLAHLSSLYNSHWNPSQVWKLVTGHFTSCWMYRGRTLGVH